MALPVWLMPLLAAAIVAGAGLAAISWVHRPARAGADAGAGEETELRVAVLGFPGAGKTALLAAMVHCMPRVFGDGVSVRAVHHDHADELNDLAQRFEDLHAVLPYPNARRSVARYPLAFDVPGVPIRFTYPDYSGELLRDSQRGQGLPDPLAEDLRSADIVLGVVDGAKIAAMLAQGPDDAALGEIRHLVRLLDAARDKVIQIVVTKWDVLEAHGRKLDEVIGWLEQRANLLKDLRRADRDSPVRIIPTSAFGRNGFMVEDEPGSIRRDPNLTWSPLFAAHPVACGINEVLTHHIHRLREPFTSAAATPFLTRAMKLLGLVTVSTDVAGNVQFSLSLDALERYQAAVSSPPPTAGTDDARSLRRVLRCCRDLADDLDRTFPTSRPR